MRHNKSQQRYIRVEGAAVAGLVAFVGPFASAKAAQVAIPTLGSAGVVVIENVYTLAAAQCAGMRDSGLHGNLLSARATATEIRARIMPWER